MSEEQQIVMDAETYAAIQRSRELTEGLSRDLTFEEKARVGQIRMEDLEEFQTKPSDAPEATTSNPQEYAEMQDDYTRGQSLEAMITAFPEAWNLVREIMGKMENEVTRQCRESRVNNPNVTQALAQKMWDYTDFCREFFANVDALRAAPKPQLLEKQD